MKKNNKKGFFLSETMVVIAIVAVVLLGVFKLFNSVYFSFMQSETYNTANAINALSNIQKYYESKGSIDTSIIGEDVSYVNLTNLEEFNSDYYDRLKKEFKIDGIYLIDLNKIYTSNDINDFYLSFRKYLNTLKNVQGIVLVVALNENEYAYTEIENYQTVTLIGNPEDEFVVYIPMGGEFVDPGYKNWEGEEPTITWENDIEVDTNKAGTYYKYYDFNGYLLRRKIVVANLVTDFVYTGDYQTFEVTRDGYYKIELWGAQGGTIGSYVGGLGGYSNGVIKMNKGETFYIYVGNQDVNDSNYIYNGGGISREINFGKPGGGATDVRYFSNVPSNDNLLWNSDLGLNSRIMVAAGGGGANLRGDGYGEGSGGHGGTLIGETGKSVNNSNNFGYGVGYGGTHISAGLLYWVEKGSGQRPTGFYDFAAKFGLDAGNDHSGGGGGYYAGSSAGHGGAGGGSSFISGYAGVNAITSSNDRTHTNNTLHYSNKYFADGEMQAGVNQGNGKAKITYLGTSYEKKNNKFDNVRYVKDCINGSAVNEYNHWLELQVISNGLNVAYGKTVTSTSPPRIGSETELELSALVDSSFDTSKYIDITTGLQCVIVDLEGTYNLDEIAVWHYYGDARSYNNHSLYVSSNNEEWTTLIDNVSGVTETANGIRVSAYN